MIVAWTKPNTASLFISKRSICDRRSKDVKMRFLISKTQILLFELLFEKTAGSDHSLSNRKRKAIGLIYLSSAAMRE